MGQQPTENNTAQGLWGLYRFIDKKQPEVKWTAVMSLLMEIKSGYFAVFHELLHNRMVTRELS